MEHRPNAESLDQAPVPAEKLGKRVNSFIDVLQKAGKDSLSGETFDRIYGTARKVVKAVSYTALTLSLAATMNHARTRYEIAETPNADGSVSYEHEDERTTEIMRFLTGTGELPQADRILFYRQAVREYFSFHLKGLPRIPEDFDSLDEAGLRALLLARLEAEEGIVTYEGTQTSLHDRVEEIFSEAIESPLENDPQLAALIWELQQRVGAPRIRWASEDEDNVASFVTHHAGDGRAFYNPLTNTIYLTPGEPSEVLAGEDAHALQFHERPLLSYAHSITDLAGTVVRTLAAGGGFGTHFQSNYERSGSFEHEAHSVIAPQILEEFVEEAEKIEGTPEEQ